MRVRKIRKQKSSIHKLKLKGREEEKGRKAEEQHRLKLQELGSEAEERNNARERGKYIEISSNTTNKSIGFHSQYSYRRSMSYRRWIELLTLITKGNKEGKTKYQYVSCPRRHPQVLRVGGYYNYSIIASLFVSKVLSSSFTTGFPKKS